MKCTDSVSLAAPQGVDLSGVFEPIVFCYCETKHDGSQYSPDAKHRGIDAYGRIWIWQRQDSKVVGLREETAG